MTQVVLQSIDPNPTLHAHVEKEIVAYFQEAIFGPLLALLDDAGIEARRENASTTAVATALRNRTLWYADGVFTGSFSSAISRELRELGAVHDKKLRIFKLPVSKLPMDLRLAVAQSDAAAKAATKKILDTLNQMEENFKRSSTGVKFDEPVQKMLRDLHDQFRESLERKGIAVPPDLHPQTKGDIQKQYTDNLDLAIKNFVEQRIPVLRKKVQDNVFAGNRTDKLAKVIQSEFGVSKRKAAFLAEQETSLLVAKYRESRYKRIGSRRYMWITGKDSRVRPDHARLHKQVFFWDQPPITNTATGARNNPGEDFGCRCRARPILNIQEE